MKPMLPTLSFQSPIQGDWLYEIKYDGFRGILEWTKEDSFLWSRNGKDLMTQFPELKKFLNNKQEEASDLLPLIFDGEITILENENKANFGQLQIRGRMKTKQKIEVASLTRPCKYLVFDILTKNGESTENLIYTKRKELLLSICKKLDFSLIPTVGEGAIIQFVPSISDFHSISEVMKNSMSEGIVAKKSNSKWESGKRTTTWTKIKNWKTVSCFLTAFDQSNGFFYVGVYKNNGEIYSLGNFINGLDSETKSALREAIVRNSHDKNGDIFFLHPSICIDLFFLEWNGEQQLREPFFKEIRFDLHPDDCTYEQFLIADAAFPDEIVITHPDKILWQRDSVTKLDFLRYLRKSSSLILPFLKNRALTVIRAPHGEFGETFYQKNRPDSAPDFVKSYLHESNEMIVCNDLKTLMWLGNQLAIEYHIPFQTINSMFVSEVVFDLDPPSRDDFHLAIKASQILKKILDSFSLIAFVKLSGNKGMQVYIPLPNETFTWDETRVFTEFIAQFMINYDPESFTIERLKKNRGGKLYFDYIQHGEGKTIVAPYSVRNHSNGLVAAPIFWHEIDNNLNPADFTIKHVSQRITLNGDPFSAFFACKEKQPFAKALQMINEGRLI
ncbi:DNA ligase D [Lederbergia wuyishanensis]|uniref:Bifunctional non-homologous end joining protein LigD n=1 Tax=Lederbergia wuyishanensis TaxID=1347903 RepID=A0ABU0D0Q1_9BACI|nr:DNA ligase D [Lederbergia wuyishanensis]MCJ8006587.1 DNA ligase D [Lederbergia wuyishanensis]MDQ0341968.1 bifunctional non-homologous end joining protein LigD [Lederbergia wuyishanensis]